MNVLIIVAVAIALTVLVLLYINYTTKQTQARFSAEVEKRHLLERAQDSAVSGATTIALTRLSDERAQAGYTYIEQIQAEITYLRNMLVEAQFAHQSALADLSRSIDALQSQENTPSDDEERMIMASRLGGIPGLTHEILGNVLKLLSDLRGPIAGEITGAVDRATSEAEKVTNNIVATVFDQLKQHQDTVLNVIQDHKPS